MKPFRIWIEHQLQRDQQANVQKIYDMTIKQLLGSARDQLHLSLSDIEGEAQPGKPPGKKGPMVVLDKLNGAQIFDRLQGMGNVDLTRRAQETQTWLSQAANDQRVGPKDTVGELLNRLFGKDATEVYGNRTWQATAQTQPQVPQNNAPVPQQPPTPNQQLMPDTAQNPMMTPDMLGSGPLQTPNGPMPPKPPIA